MLGKLLGMFILMMFNFLAALYLDTRVACSGAELIAILVGIFLAIGVLYGLFAKTKWSWPLSTIFFALGLGNMSMLYYYGNRLGILVLLVYLIGVFFSFIGLMISLLSIGGREDAAAETVEPYHAGDDKDSEIPPGTSYVWPKAKSAKKVKKSKTKKARKSARKKK